MGFSPYEYDRKSYRESKRRRKQALRQSETGYIKPYRRSGRRKALIVAAAAVLVLAIAAVPVCMHLFSPERTAAQRRRVTLSASERLRPVNKANPLQKTDVPPLAPFEKVKVHAAIADELEAMRQGAEQKNIRLTVTEGYISFDEQQKRYEKNLAPYLNSPDYTPVRAQAAAQRIVPEAGCCEAQTGLLVLFDVTDPRTKQFIERECVRYGFIQRYAENKEDITHMQQSPSAYRYVGKEDAEKMRAFDMCLEEYAYYVASQHSATLE